MTELEILIAEYGYVVPMIVKRAGLPPGDLLHQEAMSWGNEKLLKAAEQVLAGQMAKAVTSRTVGKPLEGYFVSIIHRAVFDAIRTWNTRSKYKPTGIYQLDAWSDNRVNVDAEMSEQPYATRDRNDLMAQRHFPNRDTDAEQYLHAVELLRRLRDIDHRLPSIAEQLAAGQPEYQVARAHDLKTRDLRELLVKARLLLGGSLLAALAGELAV